MRRARGRVWDPRTRSPRSWTGLVSRSRRCCSAGAWIQRRWICGDRGATTSSDSPPSLPGPGMTSSSSRTCPPRSSSRPSTPTACIAPTRNWTIWNCSRVPYGAARSPWRSHSRSRLPRDGSPREGSHLCSTPTSSTSSSSSCSTAMPARPRSSPSSCGRPRPTGHDVSPPTPSSRGNPQRGRDSCTYQGASSPLSSTSSTQPGLRSPNGCRIGPIPGCRTAASRRSGCTSSRGRVRDRRNRSPCRARSVGAGSLARAGRSRPRRRAARRVAARPRGQHRRRRGRRMSAPSMGSHSEPGGSASTRVSTGPSMPPRTTSKTLPLERTRNVSSSPTA